MQKSRAGVSTEIGKAVRRKNVPVSKEHLSTLSLEKSKSRNYGERPKPQNDFLLPNRCHIQVQMNSFIFSMNECELTTLDENIQFDP